MTYQRPACLSAASTGLTVSFPGRQAEPVSTRRLSQPGSNEMVDFSLASMRVLAAHALPVQLDP
jgi:hypothetical protein